MDFMSRAVEQERADSESREAAHKNELQLVEELLNGRQASLWSGNFSRMPQQPVRSQGCVGLWDFIAACFPCLALQSTAGFRRDLKAREENIEEE